MGWVGTGRGGLGGCGVMTVDHVLLIHSTNLFVAFLSVNIVLSIISA